MSNQDYFDYNLVKFLCSFCGNEVEFGYLKQVPVLSTDVRKRLQYCFRCLDCEEQNKDITIDGNKIWKYNTLGGADDLFDDLLLDEFEASKWDDWKIRKK